MINEIERQLNEYLSSHTISSCSDVVDFYKVFTSLKVETLSELATSVKDFQDFLNKHFNQIKTTDPTSQSRLPKTIEKSLGILAKKTDLILSPEQIEYANIVSALAGRNSSAKILDVGPGKIPVSSILLGQKHDSVTAMDSYFDISNNTLQKLHVNPITQYFKRTTSVEEFDFVAGNKPCSAIEAIVESCAKANKPYYIELCGCELAHRNNIADTFEYPAFGWENILPEIDSHIKFSGPIAYNLDATQSQLETLVNEAKITSHGASLLSSRKPIVSLFNEKFTKQFLSDLSLEETSTPTATDLNRDSTFFDDLRMEMAEG